MHTNVKSPILLLTACVVLMVAGSSERLEFRDCMDGEKEAVRVLSLKTTPYPPQLPGDVIFAGSVEVLEPLSGDLTLDLSIRRKLGFLGYAIPIPCIDNKGSCTYRHICEMLGPNPTFTPPTTATTPTSTTTSTSTTTATTSATTTAVPTAINTTKATSTPNSKTTETEATSTTTLSPPPPMDTAVPTLAGTHHDVTSNVTLARRYAQKEDRLGRCPSLMVAAGIPCHCPFGKGVYTLPPTKVTIPDLGSLGSIAAADYRVTATLTDGNAKRLMCVEAKLTLADKEECHGLGCIIG